MIDEPISEEGRETVWRVWCVKTCVTVAGMKTVFVVDDDATNRMIAKTALSGDYKTFPLPSAEKMLKMLEKMLPVVADPATYRR